jgi:hypothetical protein
VHVLGLQLARLGRLQLKRHRDRHLPKGRHQHI